MSEDSASFPCLTVVYHPHLKRVGEQAIIGSIMARTVIELSRRTPLFSHPGSANLQPLRDPFLSRRPIKMERVDDMIAIEVQEGVHLQVNGERVKPYIDIPIDSLHEGVFLTLSKRVILLLHFVQLQDRAPFADIVGESEGVRQVRRQIAQVADLEVPVLIRGETGVGKELVARCIHRESRRSESPCHVINMATVQTGTAASILFGHAKGAFTGADTRRRGLFEEANGGTLFMDEIGDTPRTVQPQLLRTLSEGTILPMGDTKEIEVDVRIIAATDVNIEDSSEGNPFRAALLHRLAGFEIRVPPLRERRQDIPRLVVHFLSRVLLEVREEARLEPKETERRLWFPSEMMLEFYEHDWPGNVRQLYNAVRQLVISNRGMDMLRMGVNIRRILQQNGGNNTPPGQGSRPTNRSITMPPQRPTTLPPESTDVDPFPIAVTEPGLADSPPVSPPTGKKTPTGKKPPTGKKTRAGKKTQTGKKAREKVDDDQVYEALEACNWKIVPAAKLLGMPRSTLYGRIEKHPRIRKAADLSQEEIAAALGQSRGDVDKAVSRLKVSPKGLRLRISYLGIDPKEFR